MGERQTEDLNVPGSSPGLGIFLPANYAHCALEGMKKIVFGLQRDFIFEASITEVVKLYFIIAFLLLVGFSQAETLTVGTSGYYSGIQDAINASTEGDIIQVQSGDYPEQVVINKNISLQGVNTGKGYPIIGYLFLCNHPSSVINNISAFISFPGCPSPHIVLENNIMNGMLINTTNRNYGSVSVIGPTLDNSTKFSGDPNYALEMQVINGPANQGEDINVSFFIPGAGRLDDCILRISIPPYLIKEQRFLWRYPIIDSRGNESYQEAKINRTTLEMNIIYIFRDLQNPASANIGSFGVFDNNTYSPPFNIGFTIADDAPSGDHNLYINLLYRYEDKWHIEKQIIPIHVRYWYESRWIQVLTYLALILGLLATIKSLNLKKYLKILLTI